MNHITVGKINPFLAAHCGMIPKGPVLFLGAGDGTEIVHLAMKGHAVTVFEHDPRVLEHARTLAAAAGVGVSWRYRAIDCWRLGFEQWAGIVALFPTWQTGERRRLMAALPNALQAGGSFLFEGLAEGPGGPLGLGDDELDPEDFRDELDILHLARFVTVSRPVRQRNGAPCPTWVLQVVGSHLDSDSEASEFQDARGSPSAVRRRLPAATA